LLCCGFALGIYGGPRPSSPSGERSCVLRLGFVGDVDNLNPFLGLEQLSYEAWVLTYSLLFLNGTDGRPTLDLAAKFPSHENGGISADGKVWTIHIRPNVKWSDGQPLTAADVAWTYNFVIRNRMPHLYNAARGIRRAEVLNATTVMLVCTAPKADMEYAYIPILPKHVWEHVGVAAARTDYANGPPVVGSGPYQVVHWERGSYLRLERNPYYWGPRPAVDTIIFEVYRDAQAMASDLRAGAIDGAEGILPAQYAGLASTNGIQCIHSPFYNWDYLNFNCYAAPSSRGNPVLRDWRFRYALNWAIDRAKLCQIAYHGFATPATSIMTPHTWSDPDYHWEPAPEDVYHFDLDKANRLLDRAGYARGENGMRLYRGEPIRLRLWALSDDLEQQTAGKMIAGWLRQVGLEVQYSVMDTGTLIAHVYNYEGTSYAPDFDMYVWEWPGFQDPGRTLSAFTTQGIGSTNEPGWSSSTYDTLWVKQGRTLDATTRAKAIWRMQRMIYEQTPQMALVYPDYLQAYNTREWTGWTRMLSGQGPAFYTAINTQTYRDLMPKGPSSRPSPPAGRRGAAWVLGLGVCAALGTAVGGVLHVHRGRLTRVEDL
jgi:peptide/nickel transport system substrate-binding protein